MPKDSLRTFCFKETVIPQSPHTRCHGQTPYHSSAESAPFYFSSACTPLCASLNFLLSLEDINVTWSWPVIVQMRKPRSKESKYHTKAFPTLWVTESKENSVLAPTVHGACFWLCFWTERNQDFSYINLLEASNMEDHRIGIVGCSFINWSPIFRDLRV